MCGEKSLSRRFFKGTGVVLAGIECSPKSMIFERTAFPSKSVSNFDTLSAVYFDFDLKKSDIRNPINNATEIPAAVAVSPPMNIPINP